MAAKASVLSSFGPPPPSPSVLQQHLYGSLLEGKTADVAIHVRGSWHAIYHLHRVVLIQSGFFSDLFTAGFAESSSRLNRIDVLFDDHNITRPAFEICIARLYGGGPSLYLPPSLIPTPSAPLTPAFAASPPADADPPAGHHPTSPRLLLSLLATSLYLSIPSIASHALACVIASVGPYTVVPYLNFAIGHGIPPPAPSEPDAALGLERIAELIYDEEESEEHSDRDEQTDSPDSPPDSETTSPSAAELSSALSFVDVQKASSPRHARPTRPPPPVPCAYYGAVSDKVGEAAACWLARWGVDMLSHEVRADAALSAKDVPAPPPLAASTSLPPAATSRRRADTLPSQSSGASTPGGPSPAPARVPVIWRRGGLGPAWVRELVGSDALFVRGERERYDVARGVVSLRRASALAETGSLDADEEREFEAMFRDGIYYANMTVEDIIALSHDISPHTGRPYVALPVLQTAHWSQSLLRCQITARPSSTANGNSPSSPTSPLPREKELGLSLSADEVRTRLTGVPGLGSLGGLDEAERVYYPVAADASHRIGDAAHLENTTSMDALFRPSTGSSSGSSGNEARLATSEKNFFGLQSERRTAAAILASPDASADASASSSTASVAPPARWTPYAPCRFGVEFWDVDALREKQRLHSHTVWYAGSLFNVYVQVVRKKASSSSPGGVQLGVYLHRQSSVDTIPAPSAPFVPAGLALMQQQQQQNHGLGHVHNRNTSLPQSHAGGSLPGGSASSPSIHFSPSIHPPSRSGTPSSAPGPGPGSSSVLASFLPQSTTSTTSNTNSSTSNAGSSGSSHTLPALGPPSAPAQSYRDPRAAVSAYFVLGCASATGGALTRFASGPDVFSVSQSWGWKSSALRTEEFLDVGPDGVPARGSGGVNGNGGAAPRECSLRVTIVLGLV